MKYLLPLTFVALLIANLAGIIAISWWLVFLPLIIPAVIFSVVVCAGVALVQRSL